MNYDLELKFYDEFVVKAHIDSLSLFQGKIDLEKFSYDKREKILTGLIDNSLYDFSLSLYASLPFLSLNYNEQKYYLNTIYQFGRIKEFFEKCIILGEALLVSKIYCRLEDFFQEYGSSLENRFNYKLIHLIYKLETKNIVAVEQIVKEEVEIYYRNKVNVRELKRIYKVIEEYFFDCHRLNYLKLKVKHLLGYAQKNKVLPKETVDFILHSGKYSDMLLVASILEEKKLDLIKKVLTETKTDEIENIFYKKIYNEIFKMKLLRIEPLSKNIPKSNSVIAKEKPILSGNVKENISKNYNGYEATRAEQQVLLNIKAHKELLITKDLILSFLFSEQYLIADYLLENYSDIDMCFEKAFVKYKTKNYSECIYLINTYINQNPLNDFLESLYYLKGLSFEEQGDPQNALNSFREVNKRNPNFKQVKKKILLYENC
jgi:hypothetical protein